MLDHSRNSKEIFPALLKTSSLLRHLLYFHTHMSSRHYLTIFYSSNFFPAFNFPIFNFRRLVRLQKFINNKKFQICGINLKQDEHFSAYIQYSFSMPQHFFNMFLCMEICSLFCILLPQYIYICSINVGVHHACQTIGWGILYY